MKPLKTLRQAAKAFAALAKETQAVRDQIRAALENPALLAAQQRLEETIRELRLKIDRAAPLPPARQKGRPDGQAAEYLHAVSSALMEVFDPAGPEVRDLPEARQLQIISGQLAGLADSLSVRAEVRQGLLPSRPPAARVAPRTGSLACLLSALLTASPQAIDALLQALAAQPATPAQSRSSSSRKRTK